MEKTSEILVSIVIPTYNRAWCINRSIDSVLAQTYPHIEIIVVDDGSTDNTVEVVAVYGDQIRLLRQKNAGCSAARNVGLRSATGDYVIFLDSDDMLSPDAVQCHMQTVLQWPNCDICVASTMITNPDGSRTLDDNCWPETPSNPLELIMLAAPPPPCSIMHKRLALLRINGFDPKLKVAEDSDLLIRLSLSGSSAVKTDGGHGIYMPSPDSLTGTTNYVQYHRAYVNQNRKIGRIPEAQNSQIRVLLQRRIDMWRCRLWDSIFCHHVSMKPQEILKFTFHLIRILRVDPGFFYYIIRSHT
jgi:glycosyltransferase involved in cell wall biosynthesis